MAAIRSSAVGVPCHFAIGIGANTWQRAREHHAIIAQRLLGRMPPEKSTKTITAGYR
jgi:hypothetical protein